MNFCLSKSSRILKILKVIVANPTHIAVGLYLNPQVVPIPFISVLETNNRAQAVRAYAQKVGFLLLRILN
ncbi:Surface presentation of antigens protein spaS [Serratia fonticola]|uniref:Surface presentation of antigens protein spaS n=1 Tax=Serratia fonticola TaxID=47917 RepID=A0A4U9V132_SERFO|nr:Surface presentation of antigens protein spaS [Serratia fonticola]